ncbi:DUF4142 domain-containing protein [Nonomuraea sp. SYSU D8015]|uniref:DUF4142 domain-containing protein n=1 Tax=Nonomuraea sp. SYSU D8015 TaxID=2593644 RepID=UPI0016601977|nr:DUF4142 domain-containing protein [Nonomuraea sp. SYSU D8015]
MRTRPILVLAAAALAGCAHVSTNTAAVPPTTEPQPSEQDRAWLRTIHQGNLAEVQAGRLAEGKGTTKQVKAIGRMLVQDHARMDVQVVQTASGLGIRLPGSTSGEQRAEYLRLRDATGKAFDQEFLASMTNAHTAAIAATQTEISKGSSPAVVSLAKTAAPKLQEHLTALRKAQGG